MKKTQRRIDSEFKAATTTSQVSDELVNSKGPAGEKQVWQTPTLEDVSEQVMAQPYIRFT
jgi:hypothetical protein